MEEKHNIKVLIVDDSKLTTVGLKTMFRHYDDIEVVGNAENGQSAVEMVCELNPDIVIMDIGMPIMDGIQATKEVRKLGLTAKIVMLTSHADQKEVFDALSAGATSYCMKDIKPDTLVSVVRSTYNGASWLDPEIAQLVLNRFSSPQVSNAVQNTNLTDREIEVLKLISEGYSNSSISETLFISLNTVKTHIKNIFQKLEVDDRAHAVMKAFNSDMF